MFFEYSNTFTLFKIQNVVKGIYWKVSLPSLRSNPLKSNHCIWLICLLLKFLYAYLNIIWIFQQICIPFPLDTAKLAYLFTVMYLGFFFPTQQYSLEMFLYWYTEKQHFFPATQLDITHMHHTFFSPIGRYLDCFLTFPITHDFDMICFNCVAVNLPSQRVYSFVIRQISYCPPEVLHQFNFTQEMHRVSVSSQSC